MTSYQEAAQRRDPVGLLRQAVLFASLWAIGSSWSIAIREIVTTIVPEADSNDGDVVLAELGAASVTTLIAILATFASTVRCGTAPHSSGQFMPPPRVCHPAHAPSSQPRVTSRPPGPSSSAAAAVARAGRTPASAAERANRVVTTTTRPLPGHPLFERRRRGRAQRP